MNSIIFAIMAMLLLANQEAPFLLAAVSFPRRPKSTTTTAASTTPAIPLLITQVTAQEMQNVTFPCPQTGTETREIFWTHYALLPKSSTTTLAGALNISQNYRFSVLPSSALLITSVNGQDSGFFACAMLNAQPLASYSLLVENSTSSFDTAVWEQWVAGSLPDTLNSAAFTVHANETTYITESSTITDTPALAHVHDYGQESGIIPTTAGYFSYYIEHEMTDMVENPTVNTTETTPTAGASTSTDFTAMAPVRDDVQEPDIVPTTAGYFSYTEHELTDTTETSTVNAIETTHMMAASTNSDIPAVDPVHDNSQETGVIPVTAGYFSYVGHELTDMTETSTADATETTNMVKSSTAIDIPAVAHVHDFDPRPVMAPTTASSFSLVEHEMADTTETPTVNATEMAHTAESSTITDTPTGAPVQDYGQEAGIISTAVGYFSHVEHETTESPVLVALPIHFFSADVVPIPTVNLTEIHYMEPFSEFSTTTVSQSPIEIYSAPAVLSSFPSTATTVQPETVTTSQPVSDLATIAPPETTSITHSLTGVRLVKAAGVPSLVVLASPTTSPDRLSFDLLKSTVAPRVLALEKTPQFSSSTTAVCQHCGLHLALALSGVIIVALCLAIPTAITMDRRWARMREQLPLGSTRLQVLRAFLCCPSPVGSGKDGTYAVVTAWP